MGRPARWFAVLASLALLTASCGDDDDDGDDGATPATDIDLSGESLEVAAIWTDTEEERFTAVLQEFEDQTGVDITYTAAGDNMDVFLDGRIARQGPPDIAIVAQPALLRQLQADGNLTPLGDDARSVVDESYDEGIVGALSVDDELYGVPFKTANKSLLWYNLSVLDDAGIEPPETWEDLQTAMQTVDDSGVAALSLGADVGWPLTDWFENVLLLTGGGDFYDQLANGEADWDSPEVRTALETLAEVWQDQWVNGGLGGAAATGFDESATQLVTEPTGFLVEGDFVAGPITGEEVGEIGTDVDFVPFPAIGDGEPGDQVILGGDFPVLLQDSEAGQALMAFLATADAQEIWAAEGGFLSSNTELDTSVYPDDVTQRAAEMIQEASETRFDLSDQVPPELGATEGQGLWKIFTDFLQDPTSVDQTATALSSAAQSAAS
jgi:alpha-glucoside transport system substrate-binding protein